MNERTYKIIHVLCCIFIWLFAWIIIASLLYMSENAFSPYHVCLTDTMFDKFTIVSQIVFGWMPVLLYHKWKLLKY